MAGFSARRTNPRRRRPRRLLPACPQRAASARAPLGLHRPFSVFVTGPSRPSRRRRLDAGERQAGGEHSQQDNRDHHRKLCFVPMGGFRGGSSYRRYRHRRDRQDEQRGHHLGLVGAELLGAVTKPSGDERPVREPAACGQDRTTSARSDESPGRPAGRDADEELGQVAQRDWSTLERT